MDANGGEEKISVLVRLRPLSEKEIARNEVSDWECINDSTILFRNSLQELSVSPAAYTFDRVFSGDFSTRVVYDEGVRQIALSVLNGINSSIFAYGQTSSGKTYTMVGITEYAVADIFDYIQRHDKRAFVMKFSAMEIYNEATRDLLSVDNTPLRLLDDLEKGVIVEKLKEETVRDWSHLKELLSVCEAQRKVGETSMNETSSRSHQILRLTIESSVSEFSEKENSATLVASVNFVDLAGSERASQSLSAGKRLKEGCHINRSLLTLGTVIRKLSKGRNGHVNYRDSKLTRILQPALGGNARTAIICTVSPIRRHVEQSRNTLLFGICAKQVNTNAKVNVVMNDKALVKHLQKELARLKTQLRTFGPASSSDYTKLIREKDLKIEKLEEEVRDLTKGRDHAQSQYDELLTTVQYDQDSGHCDGLGNQWQEDRRTEDPQENEERMVEKSLGLTANHCLDTDIEIFKKGKRFPIDDDDHASSSLSNTILGSELYDQPSENSAAASGSKKEDYDIMNFEDETTQSRDVLNDEINEERMWESELADEEVVSTVSIEVHHIENGFTFEALDNFTFEALDGFVYEAMEPNIQHVRKTSKNATSIDEDASSVDTSAPGNQLQHENQCSDDGQGKKEELKDHFVPRKNVKDPIIQPSNWTLEFEEQMRLIVELWEMCNVSLIYRTCFFLVFKGDPLDAIYMEVEIRRLSFLRETFSRGIRDDNITPTEASSLRALRRERQMLVLLMYKRFSYEERIRIYYEWDIKLESKQRKNQVVNRLWTDTNDMDRIKMSADIVANMIKFSDQGRSLKEMFGLSFTRPCPSRRKLGWRNNMSCVTFFTRGEIN